MLDLAWCCSCPHQGSWMLQFFPCHRFLDCLAFGRGCCTSALVATRTSWCFVFCLAQSEECQKTPTTTTSQKSIAIHLPFVLQYASNFVPQYFWCPYALRKGNTVSTPPICSAVRLPFVLQYASHLYRNTFWENLGGCGHRNVPQPSLSITKFGEFLGKGCFSWKIHQRVRKNA